MMTWHTALGIGIWVLVGLITFARTKQPRWLVLVVLTAGFGLLAQQGIF